MSEPLAHRGDRAWTTTNLSRALQHVTHAESSTYEMTLGVLIERPQERRYATKCFEAAKMANPQKISSDTAATMLR